MKTKDLKSNYYMFGNKGTVWSNNAHIAKNGESLTLCGTPMLSTNWARLEELEEAKCERCNELYNEQNKTH